MSQHPVACPLCKGHRGSLATSPRLLLPWLLPALVLLALMVPPGRAQSADPIRRNLQRLTASHADSADIHEEEVPCPFSAPPSVPLRLQPLAPLRSQEQPRAAATDIAGLGHRRGYYGGHDVGYGSYFPVGLDPLTILAGLAFLAFIIQTLYLLLYKHHGGLGVGAGVGVGLGPLSQRREAEDQTAWANSVVGRITSAAQTYGENSTRSEESSQYAEQSEHSEHSEQTEPAPDPDTARQLSPMSPLDALLSLLRRSWSARSCGSSWLCRIVHFARLLTEPLYKLRESQRSQPLNAVPVQ